MRVVFDTNTVVSALVFAEGRLAWLRAHWQSPVVTPLVSKATVNELIRVLTYPKLRLDKGDIQALLADYLPFTESVSVSRRRSTPRCADADDQMFVDLALAGGADVMVTGDRALLEVGIGIPIETPAEYRHRFAVG